MHENIHIRQGKPTDAAAISRLIIQAMTEECCAHFYGPGHTIGDFQQLMERLVAREDSQYSYANTLCAASETGLVVGIAVTYDGARLHTLRNAFVSEALKAFGTDHSGMDDETQGGELYLDSLAVLPGHQGQGIATRLIQASAAKALRLGIGTLGLLVDKGNPRAERLYTRCGFRYANDSRWGGHEMKHLVLTASGQPADSSKQEETARTPGSQVPRGTTFSHENHF